jgi:hypothetical protein
MADVIRLVKGDSKPVIQLALIDDVTGGVLDISQASTTVSVRFRKAGSTTLLSTISCTKVTDGTDGKVEFDFSGGVLNVDAGQYEGEIIVDFNGSTQTVYDLLTFRVRDNLT